MAERAHFGEAGDARRGAGLDEAAFERQRAHAVDDRENAALLEIERVAVVLVGDEVVEQADRRREGVDRAGETRQLRALAMHRVDQRLLGASQQLAVARHRLGVVEDRDVHLRGLVRLGEPAAEVALVVGERLRPLRIDDHHVARAGRKAEALERAGECDGGRP